jgi:hypothetical protein
MPYVAAPPPQYQWPQYQSVGVAPNPPALPNQRRANNNRRPRQRGRGRQY